MYILKGKEFQRNGYVLHHVDASLRHTDIDRYILWQDADIVMISRTAHNKLHNSGIKNGMYGKSIFDFMNEEEITNWRKNMSAAIKGRRCYFDKNGKKYYVFDSDPRVLSGELIPLKK